MIPSNQFLKFHSWFNSTIFSKCIHKVLSWKSYYLCCWKVALFASGLLFSRKLVDLAVLATLTTYFTDHYALWKAAAFGSFRKGLSVSFTSLLICLSADSYLSHQNIIIQATVCYTTGLVLLCLVSSKLFVGSMIHIFNIMGVILLAWGKAGLRFSLGKVFDDQFRAHEPRPCINEERVMARKKVWWGVAWFLSVLCAIPILDLWKLTFIITSSVMGMALILFLSGIKFYHKRDQLANVEYHPFRVLIRVVKASLLKRHMPYPSSPDDFCQNDENQLELKPKGIFLRRLDKAAIIESTPGRDEQEKAGRLCTATQVKECKIFFETVPMWSTFLGFGLLLATGNSLFSEQGDNMDGPLLPLLLLQSIGEHVSYLYDFLLRKWVPEPKRKKATIVRLWAGMVVSTFCFFSAWWVEGHRLHVVKTKGLLDKPNKTIPMSTVWLAPQFTLLGLMSGLVNSGSEEFMINQLPHSWENYVSAANEFVIDGIGSFLSVVSIYGNRNLFATTLNRSQLDKYYHRLTVLGFVNLCYYWLISTFYPGSHAKQAAQVLRPCPPSQVNAIVNESANPSSESREQDGEEDNKNDVTVDIPDDILTEKGFTSAMENNLH